MTWLRFYGAITAAVVLLSASVPSADATTVISRGGAEIGWGSGEIPNPGAPILIGAKFDLDAHPSFEGASGGVKSVGNPFNANSTLGPDVHTTRGDGGVLSSVFAVNPQTLRFETSASATVLPGPNPEPMAVKMRTRVQDPLVVGPGFGTLKINLFLLAGSRFDGVPQALALADDPGMIFNMRIAPGELADPDAFFGPLPNAIDFYTLDVAQSKATGLITPVITLGSSNAFFSVLFSDSPATIRSRIISAFSGTTGSFEAPSDAFLFSLSVQPQDGLTYTIGPSQQSAAPDAEIPEPAAVTLMAAGILGLLICNATMQMFRFSWKWRSGPLDGQVISIARGRET
jgi:hypothetical protein